MKNLIKIIPMLLILASCGVEVKSEGGTPLDGSGDRVDQGQGNGGSRIKKPVSSKCNDEFLGGAIATCETQKVFGKWEIVTKDEKNNPVLRLKDADFIFSTFTDDLLTGEEQINKCRNLKVESYYADRFTKFQVISYKHLSQLIDNQYEELFKIEGEKLLLKNVDSDNWNRVVNAQTGRELGHAHPQGYKYKSFCIAYPNTEFKLNDVYLYTTFQLWIEDWMEENKEMLMERMPKSELAAAEERCSGAATRIATKDVSLYFIEDMMNTGWYNVYGSSESTYKCR